MLSNIANKRVMISEIHRLNDPYEFFVDFHKNGVRSSDEVIEKIKEDFSKKMGILCLSKRSGDPVQWGHYADKHKGIGLEFEIDKKHLIKISYRKRPAKIDVEKHDWWDLFVETTKTKFSNWSYEKEYRLIIDLNSGKVFEVDDLKFVPFDDELVLKGVHLGCDCHLSPLEEIALSSIGAPIFSTKKSRGLYLIEKA